MSITAIAALKQNDTFTFNELFHEYHQKIYFLVLSRTKSSYIAEETTQLTFIKLWNYRHHLDESLPLSQQIFRIARTTLIDVLRKDAVYSTMKQNMLTSSEHLDGFAKLDVKELNETLQEAVQKLPPVRRKVFELSRNHYLSHREISNLLSLDKDNRNPHKPRIKAIKALDDMACDAVYSFFFKKRFHPVKGGFFLKRNLIKYINTHFWK